LQLIVPDCLLGQFHGFEGLGFPHEYLPSSDLSIAEREQEAEGLLDLNSADLSSTAIHCRNENLARYLFHPQNIDGKLVPLLGPKAECLQDPCVAVLMSCGTGKPGVLGDLDVLMAQRQDAVHVSLLKGTKRRSHDFHVLLRHRLAPRLGKPLGRCASLVDVGIDQRTDDHGATGS
jgi:hypothetical protein